ncbi:MAG: 16S rRNA (uracil(1498)-N(3))-methyltransferase [Bacteroidetes bacterium]|nr:16S rRNA (uracil(1498)-N(3))-methyltransferase [Bacteroidota bacterium]
MNIQFYVVPSQIINDSIIFDEQESKHISQVLRKSIADIIYVTNGVGGRFTAEISHIGKQQVQAKILSQEFQNKSNTCISVALASLHKRDRLEWALEKAVELGVDIFYLFEAENSEFPRWKADRLQQIMLSAAKQSKRCWFPRLVIKKHIADVVVDYTHTMKNSSFSMYVAHEEASTEWETIGLGNDESRLYFVGPEGGFSNSEIEQFSNQSVRSFILGYGNDAQILRSETAVVSLLAKHY